MEIPITRERLHTLVDKIPEGRLQDVFEILDYAEGEYSDEFKAVLDAEFSDYQVNRSGFTKQEVWQEISQVLNKR